MVLVGVVLKDLLGGTTSRWVYRFYSSFGFQHGDNIGIISSTCRHCTLSNSVMCSDSYPIPILSLYFLYHPSIPYFLIQRIFHFLVSFLFLLHACMYSHQVYNSNVGLTPKIGLSTLDGYSYSYVLVVLQKCLPFVMYCEVCFQVNCLQTCEHMSAYWAIKVHVFVKFHIHIY